jgi:hypothetical protein
MDFYPAERGCDDKKRLKGRMQNEERQAGMKRKNSPQRHRAHRVKKKKKPL